MDSELRPCLEISTPKPLRRFDGDSGNPILHLLRHSLIRGLNIGLDRGYFAERYRGCDSREDLLKKHELRRLAAIEWHG